MIIMHVAICKLYFSSNGGLNKKKTREIVIFSKERVTEAFMKFFLLFVLDLDVWEHQ